MDAGGVTVFVEVVFDDLNHCIVWLYTAKLSANEIIFHIFARRAITEKRISSVKCPRDSA